MYNPIPILEMLHFYKGRGLIDKIRYNQTIQTFYTKKLTRLKSIVIIRIVECLRVSLPSWFLLEYFTMLNQFVWLFSH